MPELADRMCSKDFLGGALLVALSVFVAFGVRDLEFHSDQGIGPAYFPLVGAGILLLLGVILCVGALLHGQDSIDIRHGIAPAVLITISVVLFGSLLDWVGLAFSSAVAVLVASAASRHMKPAERISLAVILTVLTVFIFGIFLALPVPIWPTWIATRS